MAAVLLFILYSLYRARSRKTKQARKNTPTQKEPRLKRADVSDLFVNSNDEMIPAENLTGADRVAHSYKRLATKKRLNCGIEEIALMKELKNARVSGLQSRKVFKEDDSQTIFDESEDYYLGGLTATHDEEEEANSVCDKEEARLSNIEELKSFCGESETTFSKKNRSISTLSHSTLAKGLKRN